MNALIKRAECMVDGGNYAEKKRCLKVKTGKLGEEFADDSK